MEKLTFEIKVFNSNKNITMYLLKYMSRLSLENKIFLYKVNLKPIWTYGIQLWGYASTVYQIVIEIIQRYTSQCYCTDKNY